MWPGQRVRYHLDAGAEALAIHSPIRATSTESFELITCCDLIESSREEDVLDMTECERIEPFGTTMLALALARRRSHGFSPLRIVWPADASARAFLTEINFERFIEGDDPRRDDTYGTLEMRHLRLLEPLYTQSIADLIADRVPGTTEETSHYIQLCLNELLQNTFEHAGSTLGAFAHSRWFAVQRNVRLAVVDAGIGIPGALRRVPALGLTKKKDSEIVIEAVTRTGLTSRQGGRRGGLGLKHIHDLVTSRGGRLIVISQTAKVTFKQDGISRVKSPSFSGTAIEINFNPLNEPSKKENDVF